ncbi:glycerophosphodiester phosphodiesterase [Alteromonas gilva]|uniref:glycerophosphodiester phosphodiesterase n=1 Tax=Alteromonas gilva TaxID=2987522 RepID=A0ABT5L5E9_9ALTE|nr:glycerophosphodiester phosphodiesterase [Alteromonas gilva]MDC8831624.1 glycerophosphodiester phosphodiesterase [Alteromonas gilva]
MNKTLKWIKSAGLSIAVASLYSAKVCAFDIIAHRGASGYLPEHTLAAMAMAYAQQPDYIEQDLVLTKDDQLVVLHDIHLETVTNVEQVFPQRHREDGRYYALDFTLAELKTLTVHERTKADGLPVFKNRYQGNGHFSVATFEEHLSSITSLNNTTGQNIGLYTEIKSPGWHRAQGHDISARLLEVLRQHNLDSADANIYVQCFNFDEIKRLRDSLNAKVKLVQLIAENSWQETPTDYDNLKTPAGIRKLQDYVQGIGPWLGHVTQSTPEQPSTALAPWVEAAQQAGLVIHPYTFRMDQLPAGISAEQLLYLIVEKWQFDGVFTDQVPPVKAFLTEQ